MPAAGLSSGAQFLRLARVMLVVQIPSALAVGAWLFWQFGIRPHNYALGGGLTCGYLVLMAAGMILMQVSWRRQARRMAMTATMAEASSE